MTSIAGALIVLSTGVWIGAIVFQAAIVAPLVFRVLDEPGARVLLRGLFPRFFRLGIVCGIGYLVGAGLLLATAGRDLLLMLFFAAGALMLAMQIVALALVPAINAARDAGPAGDTAFRRLHGLSVIMTVAILLIGIGVLAAWGTYGASGLVS